MFVEKLDKAQADPAVKAVVIRINSPGGGVTASDIMYQRVKKLIAKRKLPVIAIIEDVGASGAYYIACSADTIMAMPTSITGSIGVIVPTISFAGTMDKLGITARAVKSGPMKDMGSPLKPLDDKDTAVIQSMVDQYYQRFLSVVGQGQAQALRRRRSASSPTDASTAPSRPRPTASSTNWATWTTRSTWRKSGPGSPGARVVMYSRPMGYRANVYSSAGLPTQFNMVNITVPGLMDLARPQFLYMWTGAGSGRRGAARSPDARQSGPGQRSEKAREYRTRPFRAPRFDCSFTQGLGALCWTPLRAGVSPFCRTRRQAYWVVWLYTWPYPVS